MAKQTFTTGQVLTAAQMTSLQQTAMGGGSATAKTASYVLVAGDAGTTVAMNAAGATTITVNTGLFAAGDTVLIQNLGAGTCTITAGTATVNTAGSLALVQYESGILYFTATGAAIFNDYVQAGGGGGSSGLTLISKVSISASTSTNIDNVFSATYENYRIIGNLGTNNCDAELQLRVGGANTTTNYITQRISGTTTTAAAANNASATAMMFGEIDSTKSIQVHDITGPFLTQRTSMIGSYGFSSNALRTYYQAQTDATSFTGFNLTFSAACTGTIAIYGYAIT
jgi:hypothetical protein